MKKKTSCFRPVAWRSLGMTFFLFALAVPGAQAGTRLEHRIAQAPAPHQSIGQGGPQVRVHWARSLQQLGDTALNQQRLEEMRASVRECAQGNQAKGLPVKPVEEWPSRLYSNRTDTYVGQEADITYSHASTYMLNPEDCSLMEGGGRNAVLTWSGGLCDIDLDGKTTGGDCPQSIKSLPQQATLRQRSVQGLPRTTPGMRPNPMLPQLTGEVRTVAGQRCDVVTNPLDPDGGTLCFAQAVGFAGHGVAPALHGTPLSIESRSRRGFVYEATEVKMNFGVPPELFVPHLRSGFSARPRQGDL